jgi:hypothetical protein
VFTFGKCWHCEKIKNPWSLVPGPWSLISCDSVNFIEKTDLRLNLPPLNGINGKVVVLFDPNDVEQVYRHEGKYPLR